MSELFTSIVIPTWDNYDQLADCIQSIKTYTPQAHEIIIMDNGNKPLGYTAPASRGMRAAWGDLICVINDDCKVTENWLPPLLAEVEKGSWVFSPSHPEDGAVWALGWFLCFSRDGYIKTGGFDEQFKVWCADVDLFRRCCLMERDPFQVPDSRVKHKWSSTTSRAEIQDIIVPMQQEDMQKYWNKWGTDPNLDKYR